MGGKECLAEENKNFKENRPANYHVHDKMLFRNIENLKGGGKIKGGSVNFQGWLGKYESKGRKRGVRMEGIYNEKTKLLTR